MSSIDILYDSAEVLPRNKAPRDWRREARDWRRPLRISGDSSGTKGLHAFHRGLLCVRRGGLYRGLSGIDMITAVVKSLFFSYAMGIVLIIVVVRYFGRVIGVTKVYPVGMLRYFVVLGSLSVIMGLALVLSEAPAKPLEQEADLMNLETEK